MEERRMKVLGRELSRSQEKLSDILSDWLIIIITILLIIYGILVKDIMASTLMLILGGYMAYKSIGIIGGWFK
jgi:TRAP-type C4-dicarboxylate transport system permease small subunit